MGNVWFVSGTDTDVGKTVATGWLAAQWIRNGHKTITQKFIQTGSQGGSPDIHQHRKIMQKQFLEDEEGLTAPEVFSYPSSPHMASRIDGRKINFEKILNATEILSARYERLLVEGAGGLMVPLTTTLLTIDFVAQQNWPVIFVTSGKLGSINHTLLSLEALKTRGMILSHVIFNDWHPLPDKKIDEDTFAFLAKWLHREWPTTELLRCPKLF